MTEQTTTPDNRSVAIEGSVIGSAIVTGDHNVVTVTYLGAEVTIPSLEAIASHRAALRDRLAAAARKRWGEMSTFIQEEGATLPIEASPYETGRLGARRNLLQTLHEARRLLVLGEPGSGKTVALERLAWELCNGPEPVVPILVRLFRYDGAPLAAWIRAFLQETGHLRLDDERTLVAFLQEGAGRCVLLCDGLNEVPLPYRDRLVGELTRWMASYPDHPVILTSRSQDELWRRLREPMDQAVVVQPIADEQARAYLVAHLKEDGRELYARLDERLRTLARTPLILWLIKEAGPAAESGSSNRGELYARFVAGMLQRDTRERQLDAEIPARVKHTALADLALHLGQGQQLTCTHDEAVAVVARRLGEDKAEGVVSACARHGLLAGEEGLRLWFAPHQTVQEHFAALALREVAEQERRAGWRGRLQRWVSQKEGLADLAADDWWMETFVQLAGLVDDADHLARTLARANPWLAWWCVEEGRDVSTKTREEVAARSARLLESPQVTDRRRAVAALARMRNERVVEPLLRAAGDADTEVAGLATQSLGELGEAARAVVAEAVHGPNQRLWRGAFRYLGTRPNDPLWGDVLRYLGTRPNDPLWPEIPEKVWEEVLGLPLVWVPPGAFLMGSDKRSDSLARDDEFPQHEATLPGYWIGRYPVTVGQFKAFVQDSGHRPENADSLRGPDDHPVVHVTWDEALTFCRWLGQRTGLSITLPSEAEWEKAARGTDGRIYPWGDEPPDEQRCNFNIEVGTTTPVGRYSPRGDSPYGCADMAGNVWEQTRSLYKGYPYQADDGRENLGSWSSRVLRGGAFDFGGRSVRCAVRLRLSPLVRLVSLGFRVCASPSGAESHPHGRTGSEA